MEYMSAKEASEHWGITRRRVLALCSEGRIDGATKVGNSWVMPANTQKPVDGRVLRYTNKGKLPKSFYTSIDLFAGPGGLCTGFKWAGIKPLIAVEWSYWTVQTYAMSHNAEILNLEEYLDGTAKNIESIFDPSDRTVIIYGDIRKIEKKLIKRILQSRFNVDTVDIVTGGAPCESFSMAGDRKEIDDRNDLYKNILRIARDVDSKMIMFENVKGLFSKKLDGKKGEMYRQICADFQSKKKGAASYTLASTEKDTVLLKAANYGVPQMRERLFLVGINNKYKDSEFIYPEKTHGDNNLYEHITVEEAIMDLPQMEYGIEKNIYDYDISTINNGAQREFICRMRGSLSMPPGHIHFTNHSLNNHKAPGHRDKMLERIKSIQQGENMKTAYKRLNEEGKEEFTGKYFPKRIYAARNRRLSPDSPSFTVTSHCLDEMIHPYSDRGLTPREAARLQSFPDWYQFQGPFVKFHSDVEQDQYEQIGDAIPPLLAYALGVEIVHTLKDINKSQDSI